MTFEMPQQNSRESLDIKQKYLEDFIDYRNNYLDELPEKRLIPGDENYYFYKCRGNFFVGISSRIWCLINEGIVVTPTAVSKGNEFIDYVRTRDFSKFSTRDDIKKVNEILDVMIRELS